MFFMLGHCVNLLLLMPGIKTYTDFEQQVLTMDGGYRLHSHRQFRFQANFFSLRTPKASNERLYPCLNYIYVHSLVYFLLVSVLFIWLNILYIYYQWFSPDPPVSSTNKADHHDIIEIVLQMALNTIKQTNKQYLSLTWFQYMISLTSSTVLSLFDNRTTIEYTICDKGR